MAETDLTKLTRWIIPGWVAILSFLTFAFLDKAVGGSSAINLLPDLSALFSQNTGITGVILTVLLAAAGVPLGFTIYQIYFFIRWNSPFSRDGFFPPLISGRMHDLERMTQGIKLSGMAQSTSWKRDWISDPSFFRDHSYRWRFIENLFMEVAQQIDQKCEGISIYSRQRYLHEVTHTLGASIGAIYVGYFSYFILKIELTPVSFPLYLISILILVGLLFFILSFEENFTPTYEEPVQDIDTATIKDPIPQRSFSLKILPKKNPLIISFSHLSSLFMLIILLIHFFDNPTLNPFPNTTDIIFRVVSSLIVGFFWIFSKVKSSRAFKLGDGLLYIFGLAFAVAFSQIPIGYKSWIDWSFFSTTSVFMLSNLILSRNRQNAKEDELALINYTLKRFLLKDQNKTSQSGIKQSNV